MGDFGHMASEVAPIADYLNEREDLDLEYLEIVHALVVDRKHMA